MALFPHSLKTRPHLPDNCIITIVYPQGLYLHRNNNNITIRMTVGTQLHEDEPEPFTREKRKRNQEEVALAAISSKLEDGNIRAAVRILCEGGKIATPDEDNLALLLEKHPRETNPEALEGLPDPSSTGAWQVTVEEVLEA